MSAATSCVHITEVRKSFTYWRETEFKTPTKGVLLQDSIRRSAVAASKKDNCQLQQDYSSRDPKNVARQGSLVFSQPHPSFSLTVKVSAKKVLDSVKQKPSLFWCSSGWHTQIFHSEPSILWKESNSGVWLSDSSGAVLELKLKFKTTLMIFKDFSVQKINSTNKEGENENSFGKNFNFLLKVKKIKVDHCQMKEEHNHQLLILNHDRVISS